MGTQQLPGRAQVVIVGGGIIGTSTAYHLARRGWTDVVLLERNTLTSGTTWHAAGLVTQARGSWGTREVVQRSLEVFRTLEEDTGFSTGFVKTGTINLATSADRLEEMKHLASVVRGNGIDVQLLDTDRTLELHPLLNPDGLHGSLHFPEDGRGSATDTTISLARGAAQRGVRIIEGAVVTDVQTAGGRVTGVSTTMGDIEAEYVVNAGGMWGRELGAMAGVEVPLQALAHYYVVTEAIPDLPRNLPTVKSGDEYSYVKDEAGALMVGFFEPGSYPWASRGIPVTDGYIQLPEDWDHLGQFYEKMIERVPILADAGIRLHFCGPESFTPDGQYHLGEAPNLRNFFVAAGFNSVGFLSGPGAGSVLADWIVDGRSPVDLPETDLGRVQRHETNRRFLEKRVVESLDLAYEIHWPFQQRSSARPLRMSPLYEPTSQAGAVFGELAGWERANWYAPAGIERRYEYSFDRPNWFDHSAREHRAVRESVGMIDTSSFGKLLVQGRDAVHVLNRLSVNNVDTSVGRITYTQWLNEHAGIEADVTITRIADDQFLVLSGPATINRDCAHLRRHIRGDEYCTVADISGSLAMLAVMGPLARDLLAPLTDADLSNENFPFGASREIDLGLTYVRATRVTYVGELGWELLIPAESARHIWDVLQDAGPPHGLSPVGYHAMNSLRLEKAYRSWGHDISAADNPTEAGLSFTVKWDKPSGFVGREALLKVKSEGVDRRLVQFLLEDTNALLFHDEPIYREGHLVGRVASAQYGHALGGAVALGWVQAPEIVPRGWFEAQPYEIEVGGRRVPARASLSPMYDPKSERPKS
ncbi:4-methylaminobutanoate oxidase (formaldehyde-forming) [Nocardioides alpinus]|jgi:heterotetrameric sarcosine oxidase gamma subunit|uniref:FAD-dependent oxidoreductase n=2 Tax=Nocardioides TaxID=1839 RepID=A0A4Q2SIK0_9ACTN|nr:MULTISPECIES: FAD-dependent oxidoreductase [Nocardioides]PKH38490.1 FAD-dependent oxidoreductase [Nocardioides alpinus]RYC05365.1 FAD-dependent oxidoreductase [Nocardioides zhouii]SFB47783.1 4-methylaminobutanoate oxidase (formaldehyde-forming) [Nocardioides alpinus]